MINDAFGVGVAAPALTAALIAAASHPAHTAVPAAALKHAAATDAFVDRSHT